MTGQSSVQDSIFSQIQVKNTLCSWDKAYKHYIAQKEVWKKPHKTGMTTLTLSVGELGPNIC